MKRRCVFLDRDGVINVAPPPGEYLRRWEDFQLQPNVVDWLRLFNVLDYLVIVATNQRGIARGILRAEEVEEIHRRMCEHLAGRGARIDDIFCCPHEEGTCECRKPRPGLILQACLKWEIDLANSLLIGDSPADEELARRCNMHFVRVKDGRIEGVIPAGSPASAEVIEIDRRTGDN